jgi:FkbM family methyltransferase
MANFSILETLGSKTPMVTVVDIGAMMEGKIKNRYDGLVERGLAQVIGFEPEPTEFEKLKAQADRRHAYLPYFVGSGKTATFYRCRYNACSSLYRPDPKVIDLFTTIGASAGGNFEVAHTAEVQTVRLDDIKEVAPCDFLKIDVQGAELDVLGGAVRTLGRTAVVEMEVEFVPIYENQPLFAEIDLFMRQNGFLLHKLVDVGGRSLRPFVVGSNPYKPISQLLWADAVYIKDFTRFDALSPELLLKTAVLLHEIYSSIDMVAFALKAFDAEAGTNFCSDYMQKVTAVGKIEYSFLNVKDWI